MTPSTAPSQAPASFIPVGAVTAFADGSLTALRVGEHVITLYRRGNEFFAYDNRCPHMGFPMSKGRIEGGLLVCKWHEWRFDCQSGGCFTSSGEDLPTFETRVRDGAVEVATEPRSAGESALHERNLERALIESSSYLLAKSVARLLARGQSFDELLRVAARHSPRHGFRVHPDTGGSHELAYLRLCTLAADRAVNDEQAQLALNAGLYMTSGPADYRAPVAALPEPVPNHDKLDAELPRMAAEYEGVACERIFRTVVADGDVPQARRALYRWIGAPTFLSEPRKFQFIHHVIRLLDRIGWGEAAETLGGSVQRISEDPRNERDSAWQLTRAFLGGVTPTSFPLNRAGDLASQEVEALDRLYRTGSVSECHAALAERLRQGASPGAAARALRTIAARRLLSFNLLNDGDYPTVGYAFSHAAAVAEAYANNHPKEAADWLAVPLLQASHMVHEVGLLCAAHVPEVKVSAPVSASLTELVSRNEMKGALAAIHRRAHEGDGALAGEVLGALLANDPPTAAVAGFEGAVAMAESGNAEECWLGLGGITRLAIGQRLRQGSLVATQTALRFARGEALHDDL